MHSADLPAGPVEAAPLDRLVTIIRERKWVIVTVIALAMGATVVYYLLATPQYRATAQIVRQQSSLDRAVFGTQIIELADGQSRLQTGASMVQKRTVAERVIAQLQSPRDPAALLEMISVSQAGQTEILDITATSPYPEEAAEVANAFAAQFILYRQEVDQRIVEAARKAIQDQLDQMTPAERNAQRGLVLAERSEDLRILKEMQTGGFEIAETAEIPLSPFSPKLTSSILLSLFVGLLLGSGLAFLLEALDKRIKDEDSLEREFGLPVLASVPKVGRRSIRSTKHSPFLGFRGDRLSLIEPFRTLRSNLRYFEVNRRIGTILITSAHPEEGKTLTTISLGLSFALSGVRVIIIEADLRRPTIHTRLGLVNDVGLSSFLAGTHTFAEVLQRVRIDDFVPLDTRRDPEAPDHSTTLSKDLYCITSGPLPPNPAELVESDRMRELLDSAAQGAEYVLVDSPPLLTVADSLAIAGHVDAVLLTARINRITLREAREVRALLTRVGAHPIGVAAIGVDRTRDSYRYAYRAASGRAKG